MLLWALPSLTLALVVGFTETTARADRIVSGDLVIEDPWARATITAQKNGAAYMTLRNRGAEVERLVGARTVEAQAAQVHGSTVTPEGVAQMRPAGALEIPPGGEAKLVPLGTHVMLVGLKRPLTDGMTFPMTLVFERAGEVEVKIEVQNPRVGAGSGGHGAGHEVPQSPTN